MTDIFSSLILGVVEGLTEFLPISSTGHLIIVNEWFSFGESFTTLFNVVIQLGAILAVVVLFFKKLSPFKKDHIETKKTWDIWKRTIIGVVPALILGFLLGDFIETHLFNPLTVSIMLIIGGIFLIFTHHKQEKETHTSVDSLPISKVIAIGCIQCLAMIPGTSRSAASIVGASFLGANRQTAVEFSFFLAIPTMLAASGYSLLNYSETLSHNQWSLLFIGFVTSFCVALLVIKFFIRYIQKHTFNAFGYYRIILGILILLFLA